MSITKHGFLSPDMQNIVNGNHIEYKSLFDIYFLINKSIFELIKTLPIRHETELQDSTILSIFIRSINSFAAIKLLAENAILIEAASTCRNLIEAAIYIKYCSKDNDCTIKYLLMDYHESKKLAVKARDNNERFKELANEKSRLDARISELDRLIKEFSPKNKSQTKLTLENAAEQCGSIDIYDNEYTVFCQYTHISSKSLEQFCERSDEGQILKINIFSQKKEDLPIYLGTSIKLMVDILATIERHFEVKIPNEEIIQKSLDECNWFVNKNSQIQPDSDN